MATEVIKIIDPDSGTGFDYTDMSTWESNEQGDLTGIRDEIAIAKCRCTGGTADTTFVDVSGWTTSATQYIKIWTDPAEAYRHPGFLVTGNKYRLEVNGGVDEAITWDAGHIIFDGLMVHMDNDADSAMFFNSDIAGWSHVRNCIVDGIGNTATDEQGIEVAVANRTSSPIYTTYLYNNIIQDWVGVGSNGIKIRDAILGFIYNNTIQNTDQGIEQNDEFFDLAITVKNNIIQDIGSALDFYDGGGTGWNTNSEHNIGTTGNLAANAFGATWTTGTTTSASTSKLIDTGKNFNTIGVKVGSVVEDSATNFAYVTAIDSDTQLALSADIMGASEAYTIYKNRVGAVTFQDKANDEFLLGDADTVAKDKGVDLTSDSDLAITLDILLTTRPQGDDSDVGAHEIIVAFTLDPDSGELAFGEESPSGGEDPVKWTTFSDGAGGSPEITGDADWGKIEVEYTEVAHSRVYDFTDSVSRTITLTKDVYGSGSGNPTIQIRGHDSTSFDQDDGTPTWENYTAPIAKTWRYIQVRVTYSE